MGRKLNIFIIVVFVALIIMIVVDPVRNAVLGGLKTVGGSTYDGIAAAAAGITANPIYMEFHPLIWVAMGVILCVAVLGLHRKGKIPGFRKKPTTYQQPMGQPSTIIVQTPPTPVSSQTAPQPAATPPAQPDQTKQGAS